VGTNRDQRLIVLAAVVVAAAVPAAGSAAPITAGFTAKWKKAERLYTRHRFIEARQTIRPLVPAGVQLDDPKARVLFYISAARITCFAGRGNQARSLAQQGLAFYGSISSEERRRVTIDAGDSLFFELYDIAEGGGIEWNSFEYSYFKGLEVSGGGPTNTSGARRSGCPGDAGVYGVSIQTRKVRPRGRLTLETIGFARRTRILATWWRGTKTKAIGRFGRPYTYWPFGTKPAATTRATASGTRTTIAAPAKRGTYRVKIARAGKPKLGLSFRTIKIR